MYTTISEENKIAVEELKEELKIVKQQVQELSLSLLIQLKTILFQFVLSYKEYSLTNIREYGLGEILMNRALRFFRLDNDGEEKNVSSKKEKTAKRKGARYIIKKSLKTILFPIYLLITLLQLLIKSESGTREKKHKQLKNVYRE